jgi:hypothetical protein
VTHVVIVNVALFLPVAAGGAIASWFGWMLAGRGDDGNDDGGGSVPAAWPSPVVPQGGAGPDELARSA